MVVLAFDTAGPVAGVGLWAHGVGRVRVARGVRSTEAVLLPWALELLADAGLTVADLTGIGVAAGPGAFTGLRVGLATAAGLALARGVPLWHGGSLTARALASAQPSPVLAMLDARKARVYASLVGPAGEVLRPPSDVPPEEAVAGLPPGFVATGEGAVVYRAVVEAAGGVLVGEPDHPGTDTLARLAAEALARGEGSDPTVVQPVYVRPPDLRPPGPGRM